MFPTKRLNPVAGTKRVGLSRNSGRQFPTKRLNPVAGTEEAILIGDTNVTQFPTKRLNPVAGTRSV